MKTILAAIDTSGAAASVVAETISLARACGARVVLVTAVQLPVIGGDYPLVAENLAEITSAGGKAAARQLAALQARFKAAGISTKSVQATGGPISLILSQAKKHAADYIVMGSHGHTAFYDLLVGSTTHGVLLRARCPVVIVPKRSVRRPSRQSRSPRR